MENTYIHKSGLFEWGETKYARNKAKHKIDFEIIADFDWSESLIRIDQREDYGETRRFALGPLLGRLYVVVYTRREGRVRIVSLRKANRRESRFYEKNFSRQK